MIWKWFLSDFYYCINSFRKTLERMMCLCLCLVFVTKFIVIRKSRTPKNLQLLLQTMVSTTGGLSARRRAFFYFQQMWDFNFSFPWKHVVKETAKITLYKLSATELYKTSKLHSWYKTTLSRCLKLFSILYSQFQKHCIK